MDVFSQTANFFTYQLDKNNHFEKNQISIILYKRNIAIGNSELDITAKIIDELNIKLPSIKLN